MVYQVMVIFDKALGAYSKPLFYAAKGQAVRDFSDAINNGETEYFKHPGDYELFHAGEFDDQSCRFTCHIPQLVQRGLDVRVKEVS